MISERKLKKQGSGFTPTGGRIRTSRTARRTFRAPAAQRWKQHLFTGTRSFARTHARNEYGFLVGLTRQPPMPLKEREVKQQLINLLIAGVTCWITADQLYLRGSNKIDTLLLNVALLQRKLVTHQLLNLWSEKSCCSILDQCRLTIFTCWSTLLNKVTMK